MKRENKRFKKVVVYKELTAEGGNKLLLVIGVICLLIPLIILTTTAILGVIVQRQVAPLVFFGLGGFCFMGFGIYQFVTRKVHYEEIK